MKEGLTFKTLVGFDDIQKQFNLVIDRQKETIKLLMNGNFGIISSVATNSSSSPLYPTISGNTLYVTGGNIVTKNGDYANLDSFSITVPYIEEDTIVLYVYEQVGSSEKRVTNNGDVAPIWFEQNSTLKSIKFLTSQEYNSLVSSIKNSSICICILKPTTSSISLDITQDSYSYNRPLFSPCDVAHRNEIGTGSSSVPHSIGINDLTSSNLTLYEQLLSRGIIVSKDTGICGIPGKLYEYQGNVSQDTTYGYHIKLECFPNAIGSALLEDGTNVSCHLLRGTNIVILDEELSIGTVVILHTVITSALMPPNPNGLGEDMTFNTPSSTDVIITQGMQTSVSDSTVSFSDCGNIPRKYEVVFSSDGKLHKEPDILGYSSQIANLSKSYNEEFTIPVQVQIALSCSIQEDEIITFTVTGENNGTTIEEKVVFNYSTYTKNVTTLEEPLSMARTANYFTKVTSIYTDSTNNGTCTVYAIANRALDRRTRVAMIEWDGDSINSATIKDIRPISTTIVDPFSINECVECAKSLLASLNLYDIKSGNSKNHLIFADDFRCPQYLDTNSTNWRTTPDGMNFPIIPSSVFDSSTYSDCYRSRVFSAINPYQTEYQAFVVYLIGADVATESNSSVRIIFWDDNGERNERLLISIGNGLFVGILNQASPTKVQFSASGKASGISAIMLSNNKLSNYGV